MYLSPAKCLSAPLHHDLYHGTPVQTSTGDPQRCGRAEPPARANRISRNCPPTVMNSTVQDHQIAPESRGAISCELSTINNSVLSLKRVTDTPAKVFARLKAKVQRLNSEERREESVTAVQMCRSVSLCTNMQQPPADDDTSEGQDTYVLTLSPPKSTSKNSENPQMASYLVIEGHNPDLFHKPVIAPEKMLTETFSQLKPQQETTGMKSTCRSRKQELYVLLERLPRNSPAQPGSAKPLHLINRVKHRGDHGVLGEMSVQDDSEATIVNESNREDTQDMLQWLGSTARSQPVPQQPEKMSNRQYDCLEAPLQTLPNLMEDFLLQQSPRISIPRKKTMAVMSKQQTNKTDKALEGRTNVNEIHLRDWVLKLHNKELIVDGIRIDNKIPWHSSCITERVSSNIVKTASGGTYVLVGKMSHYHDSSFPSWFMKKFFFGFPEMWNEYLHEFLTGDKGNGKNRQRNNSAPCGQQKNWPSKKRIPKQLKSKAMVTPVGSASSVQPHSAPVSRSGRLIKPPLEYWRGGRITVGPDMNVAVHEDYTSTSILLTPKARPAVLLKSLKLPKEQPVYKSPVMKENSDEDILPPRRRVKQHKPWRTNRPDRTKSLENTSQTKFHDAVFSSDSGSEKVAAEQSSPQEAQSDRMYLRRGRSYSRERNSTGSESEVSMFGAHCAAAESIRVQAPEGKIKTLLKKKHLQSEKLPTSYSDSETSAQVQKIAAHVFSPPNSTKSCRKNVLTQKSKLIPPIASMAENEDSTLLHRGIKVTKTKNKQKQEVPEKYEGCMIADAVNESPHSEPKREDKSNNPASSLKRMRNRKDFGVSERNETSYQVDKHPGQLKKTDNPQPSVSGNSGKKPKPPVSRKTSRRNCKEQTSTHPAIEQEVLERAWTDQELQKLNEAVNSLPKHKSGYWVNVSLVVGTRSAEECQEQYTALYQTNGRSKGKHKAKTVKTDKRIKETAPITAKVGTLKRKKQMWDFLDHMPKDDHDDVFAGSPMQSKQIKLPVWSTNGKEPDFGHLQNPQTPSSSMFSSVKTPQCLHISPGMLRSVNRDNNDKYIYHLQKGKRQICYGKKGSPKQEKSTSIPSVRKTKKRCVAEDDNFVVWNMLSEKDGPSVRGEEDEEEEDDYFMDEY